MTNLVSGQLISSHELGQIVSQCFPVDSIQYSFAYGSGVFTQASPTTGSSSHESSMENQQRSRPMIDFIIATDNPRDFHLKNLTQNSKHYSSIAQVLGVDFICHLQDLGPGLYFHPYAQVLLSASPSSDYVLKYGVISLSKLKQDLKYWTWLYAAGRMHKPVVTVNLPNANSCDEILEYQQLYNLKYALAAALLLIPPQSNNSRLGTVFHRTQVYEQVVGLSYSGDPRMTAGAEDPFKIQKLVHSLGNKSRLDQLYSYQWAEFEKMGLVQLVDPDTIQMDAWNPKWRFELWQQLPPMVKSKTEFTMNTLLQPKYSRCVESDTIVATCNDLRRSLSTIVAPAARQQSIKGIITAGFTNSLRYAGSKLSKGIFRVAKL